MIKLKLSFGDADVNPREMAIIEGELLDAAVKRALSDVPMPEGNELGDVFVTVVNGHMIEKDMWIFTKLKAEDTVLISPKIAGGGGGQIFKQFAIIAITLVAAVAFPPALSITNALIVAGVTVGATLLLNSLIPPPVPDLGGNGLNNGYSDSQMYSISGQSNQVKRFGSVPRVYGTHRIFPNVAAAPYTDLAVDPDTGELVQYLYVVYDFGFGPLNIADIKIGDTELSLDNFSDYNINFVDFNPNPSPTTVFETLTTSDLVHYKGDFEGDPISIVLAGNEDAGNVQDSWQAIRNTAVNSDLVSQEIILNFVNPSGLYSFDAYGNKSTRRIELEIMFSKIDEDIWRGYNDTDYVETFEAVGGQSSGFNFSVRLGHLFDTNNNEFYSNRIYSTKGYGQATYMQQFITPLTTKLLVFNDPIYGFQVGASVLLQGYTFIGKIVSIETYIPNAAYSVLNIDRPINYPHPINYWVGNSSNYYAGAPVVWQDSEPRKADGFIKTVSLGIGRAAIERSTTSPVYSSFRFIPKESGQFKIRVRRKNTTSPYSTNVGDTLTWSSLTTRFERSPILTDKSHLFMELKIRATNQINGSISNLSAVCTAVIDVYDSNTQTWSLQETSNPAWIFVDLLTGSANRKAIDKSRLDLDSIVEWAEYCDEIPTSPPSQTFRRPRFQCDFVLDYETSLQQVLNQVASSAQASLNIIDGKYGVLVDKLKTTPVQIFTPRNSKNFNSLRVYTQKPHALRIKYINPDVDWNVSEVIVYDNGYDATTATEIDDMTTFACTNHEQAWRFGRYMIAQNRLRQETISLLVDFEHIVCTRGDYVQITQDVMRVGGSPARVKSVSGNTVTVDDSFDINLMLNYGYVFRAPDGTIEQDTCTVLTPNSFDVDGVIPAVGDLIILGEVGSVVYDCIVKTISPNDDMSAQLTLVEKADAIYDYESSDTLPDYDPQISATTISDFAPPSKVEDLVVSDFGFECSESGTGYLYYVELNWQLPIGSVYEFFSVLVNYGKGYTEVGQTRTTLFKYPVQSANLGLVHDFKVIAISATGRKLDLAAVDTVTNTPIAKITPPSDVPNLSINITNEIIQLSWEQIDDCDCKEYRIRYTPDIDGTWESSIQLLKVDRNVSLASAQARTGTYLIKAFDFAGNESDNAAAAITTIPNLFNLNVIEEITDSPTFGGGLDRIQILSDAALLAYEVVGGLPTNAFYPVGYYYYNEVVDLGDIYTARIQSSIRAEGYTEGDLMISWATLDSVVFMSNAGRSLWNVETEYRASLLSNVIADWITLDSIAALNEGVADNFTVWRPFIMSDATGRIFQFRLKLTSSIPNVSPRVFDAKIRVDMPDRILTYENLLADDVDGLEVIYDVAFKGPEPSPNVQVSIDDAESGDYWEFDYKDLEGLLVKFYDKNDVQVSRQFDLAIKGYGYRNDAII